MLIVSIAALFVMYEFATVYWTDNKSTDVFKKTKLGNGVFLYEDRRTGIQYIKAGVFGNMIVRLDAYGKPMIGDN